MVIFKITWLKPPLKISLTFDCPAPLTSGYLLLLKLFLFNNPISKHLSIHLTLGLWSLNKSAKDLPIIKLQNTKNRKLNQNIRKMS